LNTIYYFFISILSKFHHKFSLILSSKKVKIVRSLECWFSISHPFIVIKIKNYFIQFKNKKMKLLKISFLFFAIAMLFSCNKKTADATVSEAVATAETTTAERPRRDGRRGQRNPEAQKKRRQEMYAQLNLSEAQVVKVEEISAKYQAKRTALFEQNNGDRESMRGIMQKQREDQNKELSGVMTKEQFAKYLEIQKSQRGRRGGRGGEPPGGRNGK
jgi:Spy/CpxP family protein refolding chaperone